MQTDNRLLDDLARVATSALGTLSDVRRDVEARMRQEFERLLANSNFVTREEFEAVKEMAAKAREENEQLAARLAALEGKRGAVAAKAPKRAAARKPAAQAPGGGGATGGESAGG